MSTSLATYQVAASETDKPGLVLRCQLVTSVSIAVSALYSIGLHTVRFLLFLYSPSISAYVLNRPLFFLTQSDYHVHE
jgi:hypothetical protein